MVKIARLKCATMAVRTPTRLINTRKPAGFALTSKLLSVYDTFEEGLPGRVALFFRPVLPEASGLGPGLESNCLLACSSAKSKAWSERSRGQAGYPNFFHSSHITMPAHTPTLMLCLVPNCGSSRQPSQASITSCCTPATSLPSTMACGVLVSG